MTGTVSDKIEYDVVFTGAGATGVELAEDS